MKHAVRKNDVIVISLLDVVNTIKGAIG